MTRLVVVGASLGGLQALTELFGAIDPDLDASYVIVQHRRSDSGPSLRNVMQPACRLPLIEPEDQQPIARGTVYLAPAGYHLMIDGDRFALSVDAPVIHARPSIDVLFETAAQARGSALIGILLTAASIDGAAGLKAIAQAGGITIVQDPATAESPIAINEACRIARIDHVAQVKEIPELIAQLVG